MKQTVLQPSADAFRRSFHRNVALCIGLAGATLLLNILFLCLRTADNHSLMLILNIATDIVCGCFLVWLLHRTILPQWKLLQLTSRRLEVIEGTVCRIDSVVTRYMDIDCLAVTLERRKLFLPAQTIPLKEQTRYRFSVVSNIIVEAEV